MKVEIITLHHVRNHGSLLQTYATQKVIQTLGYDTEVMDFVPKGLWLLTGIKTIKGTGSHVKDVMRKTGAALVFSMAQISVNSFLKKWITLSPIQYHSYQEVLDRVPEADIYLSGSDQIWNTQNANEPNDVKAYYLQFIKNKKKIAYGSSIGKDEFDNDIEANEVKSYLESYSAIGVRESQAVDLLDSIGITNAVHVLDPTLLLDVNQWKPLFRRRHHRKPYVFVYNLNRNPFIKRFALRLAKEMDLDIVNNADTMDFISGAKNRIHNMPYDFLDFLYNAEYVVTDSFHGTAFCINFSKQFITFGAPRFNSRIISLLRLFSLEERFVSEEQVDSSLMTKAIDYRAVSERLAEERNKSKEFLITSLKD